MAMTPADAEQKLAEKKRGALELLAQLVDGYLKTYFVNDHTPVHVPVHELEQKVSGLGPLTKEMKIMLQKLYETAGWVVSWVSNPSDNTPSLSLLPKQ